MTIMANARSTGDHDQNDARRRQHLPLKRWAALSLRRRRVAEGRPYQDPALPIAHRNERKLVMASPTIVLIHGAFGDASSWRPVFDRLAGDGHSVLAPPNPLRGLPYDSAYTASLIDQLDGPVVLVGHSYGGAVTTVAGSSDKVTGLVYVAGLAPDQGESVNDLQTRFPSLAMGPLVRPAQLPDGSVEASIDPARFHDVFCADLPDAEAAFMAISQRPVAATAFDDPATTAAWRSKPSWAVFGTADRPVAPDLHRFQYQRAHSTVTEVEGASHFLMLSQPDTVASVIRDAATASAVNRAA
jgi:pimeloyl-ACP methyl ester carboxylesterase